ncbi:1-acyl-sn-glycerol-3-phosphate acyltransferase ['Camptotheca acuminata' phytoplasma]|uniref:1-acyl-sn-glycerol-3-phosphate acyltransferase n=1 Tax='Camptotheca acuminata' phytoplasma TaxID=3239192 RepID=UPI00351A8FFF
MFSFIFLLFLICFNFISFNLFIIPFSSVLHIQILMGILFFVVSVILAWVYVLFLLFSVMWITRNLKVDHPFRQKIIMSISKLIVRFFRIKIIVHNKELIPLQDKLVIYSNHKTNFDPFIISSIFPRTLAFTPKEELYHGKIGWMLSYFFELINCIQIQRDNDRKTVQNILKGIDNIKEKLAVVIFHEGGIKQKKSDKILNSLDGSFNIALKSEANILPVTLKGACAMRGKCWFRKKKIEVFFHLALPFETFKEKKTKEINTKVTSIINSVL